MRSESGLALSIRLFGPLEVRLNGAPLPRLRTRKGERLLALLALRQGRPQPFGCEVGTGTPVDRAWLAGVLWAESSESRAMASLRNSLTDLRRALGPQACRLRSPTPHTLALDLTGAEVDVVAFDMAIAAGEASSLETAVSLYRGTLLEGCTEEWVLPERQVREEAYLAARERLAEQARERGDHSAAIRHLRAAAVVEPARETVQRGLMEALAAAGNYAAATQVHRDLRLYLHRELNAEPDATTQTLFDRLRAEARETAGGRGRSGDPSRGRSVDEGRMRKDEPTTASDAAGSPARPHAPSPLPPFTPSVEGPPGGAVPLDSPYYVARREDREFHEALVRRDSIVLIKGARQMGKTSLLARGLQQARETGARVVLTDLELLSAEQLVSAEVFYRAIGAVVADQLGLEVLPDQAWVSHLGPSMNFNRYLMREVLRQLPTPLVWGLDQVDVLAPCPFGTEVFSLLRSWHNQRVTEPGGAWSRLTLVIAYATEAHLFVADVNQSPFNVGTRLTLADFTREEVADLNQRHGAPLCDEEVTRFHDLVGGHPDLVRRGLHEMAARGSTFAAIEAALGHDEGIFADHLRRILALVARDTVLAEAIRGVLAGRPSLTADSFYRLRSAGILSGESVQGARPRCRLYAAYLERHLAAGE